MVTQGEVNLAHQLRLLGHMPLQQAQSRANAVDQSPSDRLVVDQVPAGGEEHVDYIKSAASLDHGPHRHLVGIGAMLEQQLRQIWPPQIDRERECRVAPIRGRCACLQQDLDHAVEASVEGDQQRVVMLAARHYALGECDWLALPDPLLNLEELTHPAEFGQRAQLVDTGRT